ncbi:hypothetical protein PUN28_003636 [Cardiocondyla obscurior]|uniref:Uncharacterized protein n=1 Tax=Cardiocondyla obscurior TaxID=286306 RepID=A0AAW2GNZ9_9HYME
MFFAQKDITFFLYYNKTIVPSQKTDETTILSARQGSAGGSRRNRSSKYIKSRTRGSRAPFSCRSLRSEHPNRTDSWSKQTNGVERTPSRSGTPDACTAEESSCRKRLRLIRPARGRSPPRPSTLGYCNTEEVLHPLRCPNTAFAPRSKR